MVLGPLYQDISQFIDTSIEGFLSFIMLEWVEFTDGGISEWACGGGRQVITSWSQSRPTKQGVTLSIGYIPRCRVMHDLHNRAPNLYLDTSIKGILVLYYVRMGGAPCWCHLSMGMWRW